MDYDTILSALASESIKKTYEQKYDEVLEKWKTSDVTIDELLQKYELEDSANIMERKLRESVGHYLVEQCKKEDIARKLINQAFKQLIDNMNPLLYKMGRKALDTAKESVIRQTEDIIKTKGTEFIGGYIDSIYLECLDKSISEIATLLEQKIPNLRQVLWDKYTDIIKHKSRQFLSTLNIQEVIEHRINNYELEELERMIMEISKKELNALVWLGGLLGVLMGFFNLLF